MSGYAMLVDASRCIGCEACAVACKQEYRLAAGNFRLKVWAKEVMTERVVKYNYSQSCRHCYEPQCQTACPVGAIERGKDGLVLQNETKCMGCQICVTVCPHGGAKIMVNGKAGKCSFCDHRLRSGLMPACVVICPTRSRSFAPREEIIREAKQRLAALNSQGLSFRLEGIEGKQTTVIYILPN